MPLFGQKKSIKPPTKQEKLALAASTTKFSLTEIQNNMKSNHGYIGRPKESDLAAAYELISELEPRNSITLIGELRVDVDGVGLYFRGRRIDTLTKDSAEKVSPKLKEPVPIQFELSHIVSNDKSRNWPSIVLKQGKSV